MLLYIYSASGSYEFYGRYASSGITYVRALRKSSPTMHIFYEKIYNHCKVKKNK